MEQAVEVRAAELPPATLETLQKLRTENCESTSKDFKLQSFQLFLRRILSPDSPTRNMLMFHGTGVGKTCTAIQVAEEYILRPEFQDKKVLVIASAAVQENFRTQVFDVTRVKVDPSGILLSQQCTGRRYLDMLERAQSEGLRWENPESREKLKNIVQNMVDDFYEFRPYLGWANEIERKRITLSPKDFANWIHQNYDDRLLIVDEAHNLREDEESNKSVSDALTSIVQNAKGMTLVLLSATPMFDRFEEITFFFNLFLWNDHRQAKNESIKASTFFNKDGSFKTPEKEGQFRGWCHEYISFIRGESPFTFPFRLPPPTELIAKFDRETDIKGKKIANPRKYLPLTVSYLQSPQKEAVAAIKGVLGESTGPTIVVSPDGRAITKCFEQGSAAKFKYAADIPPFLSPSNIARHSAKFHTVLNCITETSGIVFVYSNYIRGGILQFAMALEEAGFEPALGPRMLENPSGEYKGKPRGKYAYLTSDMREKQLEQLIRRLRRPENANGQDIRVILGSPLVSEGIDFKFVRQVHILDPWYNMSRMEQIIGRGLRTCSHSKLPFEDQNCTVYLHTTRYSDSAQETYDEYMYRVYIEEKAQMIARVKRVISESSIDCSTQITMNSLPDEWRRLPVTQKRSQDQTVVTLPLSAMSAPTFEDGSPALVCSNFAETPTEGYVRPLGTYFDVRDEVFNSLIEMFEKKPIWSLDDLLSSNKLKYAPNVVQYLLQDAIHTHLKLKDSKGRIGLLENREGVYAFTPSAEPSNPTMIERAVASKPTKRVKIEADVEEEEEEEDEEEDYDDMPPLEPGEEDVVTLDMIRARYTFPFDVTEFSDDVKLWFIIDQKIPHTEKVALLKTVDRESAEKPVWARGIVVSGPNLLAISPSELYDSANNLTDPIGTDKDAVKLWTSNHIESIVLEIKEKNKILCTVEDQKLKFAAFEVVDGHVSRIKRTKTIAPKECSFFVQTALSALVQDCVGHEFPKEVKTKEVQCIYLSLAVRQAFLTGNQYITWVSPEIWSFLSKESAAIRAKLA